MDEENKEPQEEKSTPEVVEQPANEAKEESKGMSVAALVLGIVSLVLICIWYISIPSAILAIIFGIIGRKKGARGMGTAGLVLGIITIVFIVIFYLLVLAGIATMFSLVKNADYNNINTTLETLNNTLGATINSIDVNSL